MEISPGIFNSPLDQWRLDIHIDGVSEIATSLLAHFRLPIRYQRYKVHKAHAPSVHQPHPGPTGVDEEPPNINEVPSHEVFFDCGLVGFLSVQPDGIPLLPFQRPLHATQHYRVTRRTRWAKSKPTSPKTQNESPTMSVPPISPSRNTSSRTVPRPSPYSYDVASPSQCWRMAISINFKPLWKEPEPYSGG